MNPAVELAHVTVRDRRQIVLDRISLSLDSGHGLAIVASNARNATALLRVMARLQRPTVGHVRLMAQEPSRARRRGLVGIAPSLEDLDDEKSGAGILTELGRLKGLRRHRAEAEAGHWLAALGLEGTASRPFGSWPSSTRSVLSVAAALLGRPRIVILGTVPEDIEPAHRGHVVSCLCELKAQGVAIVLADRDCSIGGAVCDRVALLREGTLIGRGSPEEIRQSARGLLYAYALPADRYKLPEGDGITARRTGEEVLVLAEEDITQALIDQYGDDAVIQREPTLQETCTWMLEHPQQVAARSRLWGEPSSGSQITTS